MVGLILKVKAETKAQIIEALLHQLKIGLKDNMYLQCYNGAEIDYDFAIVNDETVFDNWDNLKVYRDV